MMTIASFCLQQNCGDIQIANEICEAMCVLCQHKATPLYEETGLSVSVLIRGQGEVSFCYLDHLESHVVVSVGSTAAAAGVVPGMRCLAVLCLTVLAHCAVSLCCPTVLCLTVLAHCAVSHCPGYSQ